MMSGTLHATPGLVLIDTQAMIWVVEGDEKVPAHIRDAVNDRSQRRLFSVASVWEMAIKIAIEKLTLKSAGLDDFLEALGKNGVELLPVQAQEAVDVATLPKLQQQAASGAGRRHQDPFDRLIAAQCLRYDLTLVSVDRQFDAYGVRRVW